MVFIPSGLVLLFSLVIWLIALELKHDIILIFDLLQKHVLLMI